MKRFTVPALFAPLLVVTLTGCREEIPRPDLAKPGDMIAAGDLPPSRDLAGTTPDLAGTTPDLAVRTDLATRPDMATTPSDMPPPVGDLSATDMPIPPTDMPIPPTDLPIPPADMADPSTDLPIPPTDMVLPPTDMAMSSDPAEFVVLRLGDGAAALTSAATAGFLERRKVSDGSLVGAAIALPTATSGANRRLTFAGSSTSEGSLNRSADGKYLVLGGYDAAVGTTSVSGTTSAVINRVLGRIDAAGTVDTSTAGNFFSTASPRSVTSTDGVSLWAAGSAGLVYTTLGSTATPTAIMATGNLRWLHLALGQLYVSSGSVAYRGVSQVGTGTPTTAATAKPLAGFEADAMSSYYGVLALDRDATPGIDVIYAADDRDLMLGGGVQRWTLTGATWKLDGTIKRGLTAGARALTGFVSAGKVVLLVTTAEVPSRVVSFVDDGTALDMLPSTGLSTAATNTAFRGIALAPQ